MEPERKRRKSPAGKAPGSLGGEEARTLQRQGRGEIPSDVLGSYTGTPEQGEMPEQDADDL